MQKLTAISDKNIAFIPLRGGSKSIPLKNIKLIHGRPLVYWILDAAVESQYISSVVVSTDSQEIKKVVEDYNHPKVEVISRSIEVSTDTSSTESVMLEYSFNNAYDNILLLQATSPLTSTNDINRAFEEYYSKRYDSILSVVKQKRFIWEKGLNGLIPVNYDPSKRPRRQDFEGYFVENGAFYLTSKINLEKHKNRISGKIGFVEMDEPTYFEIDEMSDWIIVENLLAQKKLKKNDFDNVKCIVTDCDGVLTDGGMYYTESGDEFKKFNTKDGMGLRLAQESGIIVGIITGENTQIVKRRAEKLKLDFVYLGINDKMQVLEKICKEYKLLLSEIAYIGDDLNDIEPIKKVGYGFAVNNANNRIKTVAKYITKSNGGEGAVREVCDLILYNKNKNNDSSIYLN